jgi:cytochrome c oxidase assembly protein subunit 15
MPGLGAARPILDRRLSPATYRRITLFSAWAVGFIILTGGLVRVTGSGLGCPDWPTCTRHQVLAPWQYHAWVEFGNRIVTGAVSLAVALAVLGALVRDPRRRDLTLLSCGLVAGVLAQIVLGGETVRHQLAPPFVMGHFLLSMLLLWDAVVLHSRAGTPDGAARPVRLVAPEQVTMARLCAGAAGVVVFLGTVVTSTGPHGGDPKARRLGYSLHDVARLHGSAVWLFLALTAATLWSMSRAGVPARVMRRGQVVIALIVAQGSVGYAQYFSGVPAWLVGIHLAGAASVWAAVIWFNCGLFEARAAAAEPAVEGPERAGAAPAVAALAG